DPVVAAIERKIIEHDIARGNPEVGLDADESFGDILADKVDFGLAFRLRVGKEDGIEAAGLVRLYERKIDRFWRPAAGFEPLIEQTEVLGSPLRLIDIGKSRQPRRRVERNCIAAWLDNKNCRSVLDRQAVGAVRAGANDLAPI